MLKLYRRSADHEGRPRAHRTVGSNTVRLLKPLYNTTHHGTGENKFILPLMYSEPSLEQFLEVEHLTHASIKSNRQNTGPWHTQTIEYNLEILPEMEHLVKAAIIYSQTFSSHVSCRIWLFLESSEDLKLTNSTTGFFQDAALNVSFTPGKKWVEVDISSHILPSARTLGNRLQLQLSSTCTKLRETSHFFEKRRRQKLVLLQAPALLLHLNDTQRSAYRRKADDNNREPFMENVMTLEGHRLSRKTRQVGNIGSDLPSYLRKNAVTRNECKLHSFRVSFHQLGWDHWIIAPHRYNPKYCKGDCPRILHYGYNSPNHAIVQNFINELVDQNVPRPSCVPYKYQPISVLMVEGNGNILYKEYEDMVAQSCTCK
ncbi:bone morphogenetic protein 15 [Latimeria chalumnae]|uniref:bone morphogenetic protein 15 n=1 Tax=Latimeria chalumnae TaxID=7897 RepID=UPI0003C12E7A|nr:PREDICTED: bone morphogenetic protein 15 [Latimeria chalumnae]|eukprot:XP_005992965.1 PREDICTED: bone morphogenetic protein 15 [Latimeria chalumnae]